MFSRWVQNKLGGYRQKLNCVNYDLPKEIVASKRVCIIGAGLAGISAADALSQRGFEVDLYEKNLYIGGKLGSWKYKDYWVSHGFHAFFKQYYNLRDFVERIGCAKHLRSISDYQIVFKNGEKLKFADIQKTPVLNVLSLGKKGLFGFGELLRNPRYARLISLLRYDPEQTFAEFDNMSFEEFASSVGLGEKMKVVFCTFARAFFAEPEHISMAELIKGFHFYFFSNDLGLLYEVLDDDFEFSFLSTIRSRFKSQGVNVHLGVSTENLIKIEDKIRIGTNDYDYCIIACDSGSAYQIIQNSPTLELVGDGFEALKSSGKYAVLRVWLDKSVGENEPFFVFVDRIKVLDSITFFHHMEKSSENWSKKTGGGVYELHAYSIPKTLESSPTEVKKYLFEEFYHYFPELKESTVIDEFFQYRSDFAQFTIGLNSSRPTVETKHKNLFFAGDWVKMETPAMLMEAAYTSGATAANAIFRREGILEDQLYTVPKVGLFSRRQ